MGIPEYQVLRGGGGGAALDWSRQQLFGVYIVKLRYNRWRMYRGWQLDELQWPTLEAWRVKSPCFFFTRFTVGQYLLIKTST